MPTISSWPCDNKNNPAQVTLLTAAAKDLNIEVPSIDIRSPADVAPAVARAMAWGAKGNSQRFAIAKLAAQNKVPTIYTDRKYAHLQREPIGAAGHRPDAPSENR